jgi:hypothetical protein
VLIGVPTVAYGKIAAFVDEVAAMPEAVVEVVANGE